MLAFLRVLRELQFKVRNEIITSVGKWNFRADEQFNIGYHFKDGIIKLKFSIDGIPMFDSPQTRF